MTPTFITTQHEIIRYIVNIHNNGCIVSKKDVINASRNIIRKHYSYCSNILLNDMLTSLSYIN